MPRATDLVREFKDAPGFKDGWYYRLADGYPWIGPFVTARMAGRAREHVTSSIRDDSSKPPWLKISASVALGRLSLVPPHSGPAFKMSQASSRMVRATPPVQSSGYQVRPQFVLSARRESPAVRGESAAPQPAAVPRRRGSRT